MKTLEEVILADKAAHKYGSHYPAWFIGIRQAYTGATPTVKCVAATQMLLIISTPFIYWLCR